MIQNAGGTNPSSTISASNTSKIDSSINGNVSSLSQNSISSNSATQDDMNLDYYGELFKAFLTDINIFKLRGAKITYKLSKLKTSEF